LTLAEWLKSFCKKIRSIVLPNTALFATISAEVKNMSVLDADTAKREFLPNEDFPAKKEQTMFEAFEELRLKLDERQRLHPHGLPELTEAEIDAICKEARHEFWAEHPDLYPPQK
jgi:hypothetical protein